MIYLDVLVNDYDDCLLYVNGKAYNDISEYWVDCIKFLGELFSDDGKIKVKITRTKKERKDFPDVLNCYTDSELIWKRIDINDLQYFLYKRTVKWENEEDIIIINPKDEILNNIKIDCLTKGQWYVLVAD